MTVKELSQLYWLTREIEANQRRLEELKQTASAPSSSALTGMPHAPNNNESKVERFTAEIVDLQAIIAARQIQYIHERAKLERWIDDIPDSLTRLVFRYRFVDGLTWDQVAQRVSGGNTMEGVKKRCYRYLRHEAHAVKRG